MKTILIVILSFGSAFGHCQAWKATFSGSLNTEGRYVAKAGVQIDRTFESHYVVGAQLSIDKTKGVDALGEFVPYGYLRLSAKSLSIGLGAGVGVYKAVASRVPVYKAIVPIEYRLNQFSGLLLQFEHVWRDFSLETIKRKRIYVGIQLFF